MTAKEFELIIADRVGKGVIPEVATAIGLLIAWDWENWEDLAEPEHFAAMSLIEKEFLGTRQECPECGQFILPGSKCWSCEEWTAPPREEAEKGELQ